jgi:hypothetical protein
MLSKHDFDTIHQADDFLGKLGFRYSHHESWAFSQGFSIFRNAALGLSATLRLDRYSKTNKFDVAIYPTPQTN